MRTKIPADADEFELGAGFHAPVAKPMKLFVVVHEGNARIKGDVNWMKLVVTHDIDRAIRLSGAEGVRHIVYETGEANEYMVEGLLVEGLPQEVSYPSMPAHMIKHT